MEFYKGNFVHKNDISPFEVGDFFEFNSKQLCRTNCQIDLQYSILGIMERLCVQV